MLTGPCLFESGLTPKKLNYKEDAELVNYGIGLASLVPRTTAAVDELSRYAESQLLYHSLIPSLNFATTMLYLNILMPHKGVPGVI